MSVQEAVRAKGAETLATTAYERLKREIITAVLPPGEKLHIRRLCERYEMGLSPIREALNRVSRDGLVQQNDLRGFTVAPLSAADLHDLTKARCWMNEMALRESVAKGDLAWEERLLVAYHRLSRSQIRLPNDTAFNPAWEEAHRAFHATLISACGSEWVRGFCEQLFDAADRYRYLSRRRPGGEHREDEHRVIMEAALARNADEAVRVLNEHFLRTATLGSEELRRSAESPAQ